MVLLLERATETNMSKVDFRPNSADWANKKGPHARGAMYLAGYAVECKIKAIAMEVHSCRTLAQLVTALGVDEQNVFDHGLEAQLGHLPTLKARMQRDKGTWHASGVSVGAMIQKIISMALQPISSMPLRRFTIGSKAIGARDSDNGQDRLQD